MTPLDLIKTRLQTQPSSTSHPTRASSTSNSATSPISARRTLQKTDQACCKHQSSHLNPPSISSRLDPRALRHSCASLSLSTGSLAAHSPPFSTPSSCHWVQHHPSPQQLITSLHLPRLSTAPASGIIDSIFKIVQHEGVWTLWRGLVPALLMSIPAQAVYMLGYDQIRTHLLELTPSLFPSDLYNGRPTGWYPTTIAPLLAGALSRSLVAVLFCPLELVRTRLQSTPALPTPLTQFNHNSLLSNVGREAPSSSRSIIRSTLASVKQSGLSSLYRGLPATLWRDVPFSAIYWSSYEVCRKAISHGDGFGESVVGSAQLRALRENRPPLTASMIAGQSFLAGGISGCIAAILTNPFDVAKTRRQAHPDDLVSLHGRTLKPTTPSGTLGIILSIARDEGRKGLMKGLSPRLAKIIPSCGIMIVSTDVAFLFLFSL